MIQDRHPSGSVLAPHQEILLDKLRGAFYPDEDPAQNVWPSDCSYDGGLGVLTSRVRARFDHPSPWSALVAWLSSSVDMSPTLCREHLIAYCTSDDESEAERSAYVDIDRAVVTFLKQAILPSVIAEARSGSDQELAQALRGGADDWLDSNIIAVLGERVELVDAAADAIRSRRDTLVFDQAVSSSSGSDEVAKEHPDITDTSIRDYERQLLLEDLRGYLRDLVCQLDDWKRIPVTLLEQTIDKIFIAQGWANAQIPNEMAFRKSLRFVVDRLMRENGLANYITADALEREAKALSAKAERYTGMDVFMSESRNGFYFCNWEADYPSVLGSHAGSRKETFIDVPLGRVRFGVEEELAETIRSYRVDGTLLDDQGDWLAICNFHVVQGRYTGPGADSDFVLSMDELDNLAAVTAHTLSQKYGAEAIFSNGDLAILSQVEVRSDHRCKGIGVPFLSQCLALLRGEFPRIGSFATSIVPAQYEDFDDDELPESLLEQRLKDQQKLESYFDSNKETLLAALSSGSSIVSLYTYDAVATPDLFDVIFPVGSSVLNRASL
jgi:hypothetical protein